MKKRKSVKLFSLLLLINLFLQMGCSKFSLEPNTSTQIQHKILFNFDSGDTPGLYTANNDGTAL
jgi:hypothetical protein